MHHLCFHWIRGCDCDHTNLNSMRATVRLSRLSLCIWIFSKHIDPGTADDQYVSQFTLPSMCNVYCVCDPPRMWCFSPNIHTSAMLSTVQIWMWAEVVMWRKQKVSMEKNHYSGSIFIMLATGLSRISVCIWIFSKHIDPGRSSACSSRERQGFNMVNRTTIYNPLYTGWFF